MRWINRAIKLLAITPLLAPWGSIQPASAEPKHRLISQFEGDQNEISALRLVWPVINPSSKGVRVYYRAACQSSASYPIPFPQVITRRSNKGANDLSAIRDIFRGDGEVNVTKEEHGIVRIRIGNVPDDILRTRIPLLAFTPLQQYDPTSAIRAVVGASEFEEAMKRMRLQRVSSASNQLVQMPSEGLPHLPPSMRSITVDGALDTIARTFNVAVVYGYCPAPPTFDIRVIGRD
jgi:hypothetical protein